MSVMCWRNVCKGRKNLYKHWICESSLLSVVENVCPEKKFILKVSAFKLSNIADCRCWYLFVVLVGVSFSTPVQTGPTAYPASYTMGTRSHHGGKPAWAWHWPPNLSSVEVKERVELYLYSLLWAFVAWSRLNFNLMGTGSFPGVKQPGCGVDHPPPSSAEVEGRVELYSCSSCGPSCPVLGWTLFYFTL